MYGGKERETFIKLGCGKFFKTNTYIIHYTSQKKMLKSNEHGI